MPTLAHALLEALKDHGAHEIFGIPGDFVLPLFKVIEESNISRAAMIALWTSGRSPGERTSVCPIPAGTRSRQPVGWQSARRCLIAAEGPTSDSGVTSALSFYLPQSWSVAPSISAVVAPTAGTHTLCHVWTAPAVQEEFDVSAMVGCGHVFGLFLQPLWPLAML